MLIGPLQLIFRQRVMMTRGVEHFWFSNGVLFHLMLMRRSIGIRSSGSCILAWRGNWCIWRVLHLWSFQSDHRLGIFFNFKIQQRQHQHQHLKSYRPMYFLICAELFKLFLSLFFSFSLFHIFSFFNFILSFTTKTKQIFSIACQNII